LEYHLFTILGIDDKPDVLRVLCRKERWAELLQLLAQVRLLLLELRQVPELVQVLVLAQVLQLLEKELLMQR
jgi:hypothetical protein